jgi:hypothetical protein
MTVSNAQRAQLRRLIGPHPAWPAYRRLHGLGDTSSLGSALCLQICDTLKIDYSHITNTQDTDTMTPAPKPPAGMFDRRPAEPITYTPAAASPVGDVGAALDVLREALARQGASAALEAAMAEALERIAALEAQRPAMVVVNSDHEQVGPVVSGGHKSLPLLIRKLACRKLDGTRLNVWMTGPAGSGKTFGCAQAAAALGLDFAYHGSMTQAFELLGFVDAGGTYRESHFVRCYREGGLCLLDEVDSGSDEARLAINGALSGSLLSLPNGEMIRRHPDFACVGNANTWGMGGTPEYTGRTKVDGAFLTRFVKLAWGYDEQMEREAAGADVSSWVSHIQAVRAKAAALGLKVLITPRASIDGGAMIRGGFTQAEAADATYLSGLSDEQKAILAGV